MPIFEYVCRECASEFEKIVFGEPLDIDCPACGSKKTEKMISTFAVSGNGMKSLQRETGPCPCGAPRRGMCGENN